MGAAVPCDRGLQNDAIYNQRVVAIISTSTYGNVAMVMIGATCVGTLSFYLSFFLLYIYKCIYLSIYLSISVLLPFSFWFRCF